MAEKSHFRLEESQHGRVVDPGAFNKTTIILLRPPGCKMIITNKVHITSYPAPCHRIIIVNYYDHTLVTGSHAINSLHL